MALLSMNEMTTYRWSFEEDVEHYAALGIPAIGVWRQKLSDFGEEKGTELIAERGLRVSNLLWGGGFTGGDGRTFRESIDDCIEAIRLAGQMRAGCLVIYSGPRAGHTLNHARRLLIDALKELAPVAAEHETPLAIEPMRPDCAHEWTFLTSIDDALALLDSVDSRWLRLVFDSYHFGQGEVSDRRLREIAPRVAVVHLADGRDPCDDEQVRTRLGEGVIRLKEIVSALSDAGYDGYYDVELFGQDIEAADYPSLVEHSKVAFERLMSFESATR